jgi:hypothetical protein
MRLKNFKTKLAKLGVNDATKLHITHSPKLSKSMKYKPQSIRFKPHGFWYAVGFGWLDFATYDMQGFYDDKKLHAFSINTDRLNILKINNISELFEFDNNFKHGPDLLSSINWVKVAEQYDGIEIPVYLREARYDYTWYYGWDVASGCVWNTEKLSIKKVRKNIRK